MVLEVKKGERKKLPAFDKNWAEKFAFMYLPGFWTVWQLEGRLVVEDYPDVKVLMFLVFLMKVCLVSTVSRGVRP